MIRVPDQKIADLNFRIESATSPRDLLTLISLKIDIMSITQNKQKENEIYIETKRYIKHYIQTLETAPYGYDAFSIEIATQPFGYMDLAKQIQLTKTLTRELEKANMTAASNIAHEHLIQLEIKHLRSGCLGIRYITNNIVAAHKWALCSYKNMAMLFAIVFAISCVILAPLPEATFLPKLFYVQHNNIASSQIASHMIFVSFAIAGIDGVGKVVPANIVGSLILVAYKVWAYIFAIHIVAHEAVKRMHMK